MCGSDILQDEAAALKDVLHTASRELRMVTRLVDNAIRPEEKEKEASSNSTGAERYTPSKETTTSAAGM